ncbi:Protein CBG06175 [Caenorhabditis briggsae]|uniref:Protein CBG06175 n=3 Tax=Caenorhabditis briggsae TaxID=6238 RepID=A8X0R3_CAEBR|nr:Protein CBG06175 [Caenorhabditis briggsae]UMM28776.1 hypothetical protein L5515_011461 [Caenorhabditis briggsae]CAP26223.1 Protein CBG06175 [Caenorhabditis briggsae]
MTITDESTSRVADSTVPPATSSPSFFQKICCCCNSDLKEPPVQLIRSGSLTYQQGAAVTSASEPIPPATNVISAAKRSVDDDVEKPQTSQKPNQKEGDADSVNMNDILMEKILSPAEEDRTEAVEEDVVSISTNVIQEVDENELKKAMKPGNDANSPLKGRSGISKEMPSGSEDEEGEVEGDNRKMSVIEFIRREAQAETSTTLPPSTVLQTIPVTDEIEIVYKNEKMSEATQSEMSDSEGTDEDDSETAGKQFNMVGMSSKTTARAEKNGDAEDRRVQEFKELSSDESLRGSTEDEDDEEIITRHQKLEEEEDVPPPLPLTPPPNHYGQLEGSPIPPPRSPRKSMMYANADDSDSDDEESEDAHPVSPPSNGLVRMHPVNFAAHKEEEDDARSVSSDSSLSTASDVSGKENEEETNIGVTRISVKSDGRAEIHSPKSPVRVTLDTDRNEVTDDDFSEKLI